MGLGQRLSARQQLIKPELGRKLYFFISVDLGVRPAVHTYWDKMGIVHISRTAVIKVNWKAPM